MKGETKIAATPTTLPLMIPRCPRDSDKNSFLLDAAPLMPTILSSVSFCITLPTYQWKTYDTNVKAPYI